MDPVALYSSTSKSKRGVEDEALSLVISHVKWVDWGLGRIQLWVSYNESTRRGRYQHVNIKGCIHLGVVDHHMKVNVFVNSI